MNRKTLCLLPCFLLAGCSAAPEAEPYVTPAAVTAPGTPDAQLPPELQVPQNAAYCQIRDDGGYYFFYDDHNNCILEIYGPEENSRTATSYRYNADGSVDTETVQDWTGTHTTRYVYNRDGTVHQAYLTENGTPTGYLLYDYDSHGQVRKESSIDQNGSTNYTNYFTNEYDSEGRLTLHKEKGVGLLNVSTAYEYDDQGNVSREVLTSLSLDQVVSDTQWTYDEYGRKLTETQHFEDSGEMHSTFCYVNLLEEQAPEQ